MNTIPHETNHGPQSTKKPDYVYRIAAAAAALFLLLTLFTA
jgi:hypothetical protein